MKHSKQCRHMRTSKRGKKFRAGRGMRRYAIGKVQRGKPVHSESSYIPSVLNAVEETGDLEAFEAIKKRYPEETKSWIEKNKIVNFSSSPDDGLSLREIEAKRTAKNIEWMPGYDIPITEREEIINNIDPFGRMKPEVKERKIMEAFDKYEEAKEKKHEAEIEKLQFEYPEFTTYGEA